MREFDLQLLRLKQCLALREDQEVAAILGLSKHAFSDRKKRGSFPRDRLLALKVNRPDLDIDDAYILKGVASPEYEARRLMKVQSGLLKNVDNDNRMLAAISAGSVNGVAERAAGYGDEELELLKHFRAATPGGRAAIIATARAVEKKKGDDL